VIYLDTSALMKLVREEAETVSLRAWLGERPDEALVTSELGRVETLRAARRLGVEAVREAGAVIGDVDLVPLDRGVQDLACEIGDPARLWTLDALHVASAAILLDELTAFVTYDRRLVDAARDAGLPTVEP
jgi:uncharacterized protein